ncbi:hypothetical protein ACI2JW_08715 [Serratia ureilytica]|uniref:hypothetical protein n=1 Tax=Serratia ureilytica TaxID=300181 RepID=UPI003850BDEB
MQVHTVPIHDRFGLIEVKCELTLITDEQRYNANGFPRSYIIDKDIDGTRWPKSEQVARCGNSVPPPFA